MDSFEDDSIHSAEDQDSGKNFDPRWYKTSLCTYYLQGTCTKSDSCPFAHGTNDLRVAGGGKSLVSTTTGSSPSSTLEKRKMLCVKFVANGVCPYENKCMFAHSIKEVKQALEAESVGDPVAAAAASNPLYKTSLCQNYMSGHYCAFADRCQYAHGRHELRKLDVDQLPPDFKQKKLESLKKQPAEMSDAALHSSSSLTVKPRNNMATANSNYKTVMCKNISDCKFLPNCKYAHSLDELRTPQPGATQVYSNIPCRNLQQQGFCPRINTCKFNHSFGMQPPMPVQPPQMVPPPPSMQFYQQPISYPTLATGSHSLNTYVTKLPAMCKALASEGFCPKGKAFCQFAHSEEELMFATQAAPAASVSDDKYKTVMCKMWTDSGNCKFGSNCKFAHGKDDLRSNVNASQTLPYQQQQQGPDSTHFKVAFCTFFAKNGWCKSGDNCSFAHGASELRCNYKTTICRHFSMSGNCPKGDICLYAHGQEELFTNPLSSESDSSVHGVKRFRDFDDDRNAASDEEDDDVEQNKRIKF